jgi:ubiquinone/menaquinone biosynthesis C-methylase UbiE
VIPAGGEAPAFLSYRWRDAKGGIVSATDLRTALPVDIFPGRVLSVPLWLATPDRTGRFTLEIHLSQEGATPREEPGARFPVTVTPVWRSAVPKHWLTLCRLPETYDYGVDHEIGRVFVKEELARSRTPVHRVLEVGGGSNPMTWDLPADIVCTDIDIQTLQIGSFRYAKSRPNIHFLAANAASLPFADGTFDCAVIFAALHHLADPAHCLREMRRVVQRDGFVAILCEPVGSYRAETLDAQFRKELADGINEQAFTLEEYARMFEEAGLVASRAVIDGASLKAILRRRGSMGQTVRRLGTGLWSLGRKAKHWLPGA